MGLLERMDAVRRRRRSWPVGNATEAIWESRLGHDDSQFSPEEYGDYLVTSADVFAVASLRARLMSGLDLRLFRGRGQDKTAVTGGPVVDLLRRVNPFWTWPRLARMDELAMCLWGESYWAIEKDATGTPREIWWMKPSRVTPQPHPDGYLAGFWYEGVAGQRIPFRPDEVVWQRYPNPLDEFSALSPVAGARLAAETGSEMMRSNRALWENGLQNGAFVVPATDKVAFSKPQAEDLQVLLEEKFRGGKNAHRFAVLRFEAQVKELGITQHDAEFLGGMAFTLRQVCNAYGMPSPLLNDMEHATLANLRELLRGVWENTLIPDSALRAAEIEEQLLPMFRGSGVPDHAAWDFSQVPALQESASDAWGRDRQAIEVGLLTINEVRADRGKAPVPWGDVWWGPVNKFAIDSADSAPKQPDPGAPSSPPPTGSEPRPESADERAFREVLASFGPVNGSVR